MSTVLLPMPLLVLMYITSIHGQNVLSVGLLTPKNEPARIACLSTDHKQLSRSLKSTDITLEFSQRTTNIRTISGRTDGRSGDLEWNRDLVVEKDWVCDEQDENSIITACALHANPKDFLVTYGGNVDRCSAFGGRVSNVFYDEEGTLVSNLPQTWLMEDLQSTRYPSSVDLTSDNILVQLPKENVVQPLVILAVPPYLHIVPSKRMIVNFHDAYLRAVLTSSSVHTKTISFEEPIKYLDCTEFADRRTTGTKYTLIFLAHTASCQFEVFYSVSKMFVYPGEAWTVYQIDMLSMEINAYVRARSRTDIPCVALQYYCMMPELEERLDNLGRKKLITLIRENLKNGNGWNRGDRFNSRKNIISTSEPPLIPTETLRPHNPDVSLPQVSDAVQEIIDKANTIQPTGSIHEGYIPEGINNPKLDCMCPEKLNMCPVFDKPEVIGYTILQPSAMRWNDVVQCLVGNISSPEYSVADLFIPLACKKHARNRYHKNLAFALPMVIPDIKRNITDMQGNTYAAIGCKQVIPECLLAGELVQITLHRDKNYASTEVHGSHEYINWYTFPNDPKQVLDNDTNLLGEAFSRNKSIRVPPSNCTALTYGAEFAPIEIHVLESAMEDVTSVSCDYPFVTIPKRTISLSNFEVSEHAKIDVIRNERTVECRASNVFGWSNDKSIEFALYLPGHVDNPIYQQISIECPIMASDMVIVNGREKDWSSSHFVYTAHSVTVRAYCSRQRGKLTAVVFFDSVNEIDHDFKCSVVEYKRVIEEMEGTLSKDAHSTKCSTPKEIFNPEVKLEQISTIANDFTTITSRHVSCHRPHFQTDTIDLYGREQLPIEWCPYIPHDLEIIVELSSLGGAVHIISTVAYLDHITHLCHAKLSGTCSVPSHEDLSDPSLILSTVLDQAVTNPIVNKIAPRAYAYCVMVLPDGSKITGNRVPIPMKRDPRQIAPTDAPNKNVYKGEPIIVGSDERDLSPLYTTFAPFTGLSYEGFIGIGFVCSFLVILAIGGIAQYFRLKRKHRVLDVDDDQTLSVDGQLLNGDNVTKV